MISPHGLIHLSWQPRTRRMVQAVIFEVLGVMMVTPILMVFFEVKGGSSLALAVIMSAIAMLWNTLFNTLFEHWETQQTTKGRPWRRRVVHGVLFETGLALVLIPLMAWWLNVSWLTAFLADFGLMLLFMVYAMLFTWCFDAVFGLPESAKPNS